VWSVTRLENVVDFGSRLDASVRGAVGAQRMLAQERFPKFPPVVAIAAGCCAASRLLVLGANLFGCGDAARPMNGRSEWHADTFRAE